MMTGNQGMPPGGPPGVGAPQGGPNPQMMAAALQRFNPAGMR
jgi:hypothetical protein